MFSTPRNQRRVSFIGIIKREKVLLLFVMLILIWIGAFFYVTFDKKEKSTTTTTTTATVPVTGGVRKNVHEKENDSKKKEDEKQKSSRINKDRQAAIKKAFLHAWNGYVTYAWGADELLPVSKAPAHNWGGLGATIIDSLDTMLIMELDEPFQKARAWVSELSFEKDYDASTFETTIRFLGGLLAAYDLSSDELFLKKAIELGDALLPAFRSNSGIPYSTVNLKTGVAHSPTWSGGSSFLSEFGTIQLEFKYLSHKSGNPIYAEKVTHIMDIMSEADTTPYKGLYPIEFHPDRHTFTTQRITFGARGDSFYEYLLKQYLQTGKTDTKLWTMYERAMTGVKELLLFRSTPSNLTYIAEWNDQPVHKMDHLVCFVPGMLALDGIPEHLPLAREIMYTCWQFYERNPTGLAPEIAGFREGEDFFNQAAHYLLRPETLESMFVLYRVTGDPIYQEWGWKIFESLETYCKTEAGFSGLKSVGVNNPHQDNKMESFFMAETLKYLYLLFSPVDLIPLDEFVFNTEAHPTRKFTV